ncbi:TauD/TfdA family dioxygenase [Actinosynnema sp. NPDC020468]|uniref:TauD/TfdA family dioxygenase n=1 Tax=Actinosynnema sp. NPDC020468 TaxID=3154488 RepID=UPI00340A2CE6
MTPPPDIPRSVIEPTTVVLTEDDRHVVRALAEALSGDPGALIDTPEWVAAARDLSCTLPLHLREAIRRFQRDPGEEGVLVVSGLPVDADRLPPTPSESGSVERHPTTSTASIALTALQLGDITAFRQEKGGALVQNIVPVPGREDFQGNEGSAPLKMHIENGFHPHRPDYVSLLCLRNDHEDVAALRTASIRRALPLVSDRSREVLAQQRFITHPPRSFGDSAGPAEPASVLSGHPDDPDVQVDFACTEPLDEEAKQALAELDHAFDRSARTFTLRTGDLAIVDNRITLHGRTAFRARYDGRDRWLHRVSVHVDSRRTRPVRSLDGDVLG